MVPDFCQFWKIVLTTKGTLPGITLTLKLEDFLKELKDKKITNLIVCGIETHICIQQTVLDCLQKGFEVILVSDAMSSRNRVDHEIALQRMTKSGAILTTTESIIFELCKTADRKEFKEIRNIIIS